MTVSKFSEMLGSSADAVATRSALQALFPNEQSASFTYNSDGTVATKTLADGTVISYTYSAGILTQSSRVKTGTQTVQKAFAYNGSGQLTTTTRTLV